jgi:hypothetical protein
MPVLIDRSLLLLALELNIRKNCIRLPIFDVFESPDPATVVLDPLFGLSLKWQIHRKQFGIGIAFNNSDVI